MYAVHLSYDENEHSQPKKTVAHGGEDFKQMSDLKSIQGNDQNFPMYVYLEGGMCYM